MRIIMFVLIILAVPAIAFSATLKVPSLYPNIQDAIDAASGGDTILVEPGTYVENIDFKKKAITVTSEQGVDVTFIDGNQAGSVVTCQSGEGLDSVLDGFTITNGYSSTGGGMYNKNSSPTVTNCTFTGNTGGGMCNDSYSSPTVTNCIFTGNQSFSSGGGMSIWNNSSPTVTNCIFTGNQSFSSGGGGISADGYADLTVVNCTFAGNMASSGYSGGGISGIWGSNLTVTNCAFSGNTASYNGGGMYIAWSTSTVTNCTFSGNSGGGGYGGGMYNSNSSPMVTNCTFSGNEASSGGGMCNYGTWGATVTNCTFTKNLGDGMYNYEGNPTVTNCTLTKNSGSGMASDIYTAVTNCIVWDNETYEIYGDPTVTYSDIKGGYTGTGNIDSDPLFVNATNGDFHLTFNSPCRASGDNSVITVPYDFEGDPRIAYGTVDMGADEFYTHLYWTGDATPGGNVEIKLVGLPGTNPVFFWVGSGVLGAPIPTMYGDWHLDFPILLSLGLGPIFTPEGVSVLPYIFDPGFPAMDIPMQALIGAELTNLCVLDVK